MTKEQIKSKLENDGIITLKNEFGDVLELFKSVLRSGGYFSILNGRSHTLSKSLSYFSDKMNKLILTGKYTQIEE